MERIATRDSYGEALCELGLKRPDMIVLDADLAEATKTVKFKNKFPERFFNCGIQEANMMGVAAGIAATGRLVFASSFAMFAAGRPYEVIRNCIGYPHLNVKIGATHAGISVGEDGASHQCNEDIAIMRTIPGMTVINPSDAVEAKAAVLAMENHYGPVYFRFGRLAVPVINKGPDYKFEIGKGIALTEGDDVAIVATGLMVAQALEAYEMLRDKGVNARIINIHTIKPLDEEIILRAARETNKIITVEEHSTIGGLGSAVAELLAEKELAPAFAQVGIKDEFGVSGPALELLKKYGLCAENIVNTALQICAERTCVSL